jgi:alginate O-acetyltransferase complex protein AlgJ
MKSSVKKIYISIATLLLVLPMALMPFFYKKNEADIMEMDKRYATSLVDVINSPTKLATLESWFSDHLGLRKAAISTFSHLNVAIGVSNNPYYVVLGKDGWMFLGNVHAVKIDQYRRIVEYDEGWVKSDVARISALKTYLNNQGIAFLFAVPPNKENVYPEYMPAWMTIDDLPKYAEIFKAQGGTDLLYELYPDIAAAKDEYGDILYPKTDAHWTALGAYYGYSSMIDKINAESGTSFLPVSMISYNIEPFDDYELTKALGYAGTYDDIKTVVDFSPNSSVEPVFLTDDTTWQGLQYYRNDTATNQATVLLLGDSFSGQLSPYFKSTFSNYYFIHYANVFGEGDSVQSLDELIEMAHPDVIILEIIERHLPTSINLMPESYPAE